MLPNRYWTRWTPIQRATYLAQVATLASLFATVAFSFLSWREAVKAREVSLAAQAQAQSFFVSQNPPLIELVRIDPLETESQGLWLFFIFKNTGGSEARSPCVSMHDELHAGSSNLVTSSCEGENPYTGRSVNREETFSYQIPESFVGFKPGRISIWKPGQPLPPKCENKTSKALLVDINYTDIAGTKRSRYEQVFICAK